MIGRKMAAVAVGVAAMMALVAMPASAEVCQEPQDACYQPAAQVHIREWTHRATTPGFVTLQLNATNTNQDTNIGAHDAYLVVTYQRGATDYFQGPPQTLFAVFVPDGGSFSTTFTVPKYRISDGTVIARIEDVFCDDVNETVTLVKV